MLTIEYIQNNAPVDNGTIQNRLNFFGSGLYKLSNGNFYLRLDHHFMDELGFNIPIQIFSFHDDLFAYLPESGMQTRVESINMIHSQTVGEFTGFEPGRQYRLDNGQIWEQVGGVSSNCEPGGTVLIKDENLMQIGNWDFEIPVRRVK